MTRRILDIVIVTLHSRAEPYYRTLVELQRQITKGGFEGSVRIITEVDDGSLTIGEKRNNAMARTEAEYTMHTDDDDAFAGTFIKDIVNAVGPGDVDCVGVRHLTRMVNGVWQKTELSSKHKKKHHDDSQGATDATRTYCRPATHMNPMRREIAIQFPFPHIDQGEDTQHGHELAQANVLKTERMIEEPIYFYVPSWLQRRGVPSGTRPPE